MYDILTAFNALHRLHCIAWPHQSCSAVGTNRAKNSIFVRITVNAKISPLLSLFSAPKLALR